MGTGLKDTQAILRIADDESLLEIGRKAIEDSLIKWRDGRMSEFTRGNGFVIRERDGKDSHIIRFGPEHGLRIALKAMATSMKTTTAKIVIIESPYAGDVDRNVAYARACMRDSLMRGEAPYASHLLYTQPGVLCDLVESEREHGIQAGFAFRSVADITAVYADLGISRGMTYGIEHAQKIGCPIEERRLGAPWSALS